MKRKKDQPFVFDRPFEEFLAGLQKTDHSTWNQLIKRFRQITIPWIKKRTGQLPSFALMREEEFALEVFAESLGKFYELFPKSNFNQAKDLQSLFFKIAELKIKEGLAAIKRDQKLYRPVLSSEMEMAIDQQTKENNQYLKEKIELVHRYLNTLTKNEQNLLKRYYRGEKLVDIANDLGISEANCRKRKQRAFEKLKSQFFNPIPGILFWLWIENI